MVRYLIPSLLVLGLGALLVACGGDPPDAQASGDHAVDEPAVTAPQDEGERVRNYRLSIEVFRRLPAVHRNLAEAVDADPALAERMEHGVDDGLDATIAHFEREPAIRRAIESAGMTIEDYLLTMSATVMVSMYEMFGEGVSEEHRPAQHQIDFMERHREEVERISAELQEIEPEHDY